MTYIRVFGEYQTAYGEGETEQFKLHMPNIDGFHHQPTIIREELQQNIRKECQVFYLVFSIYLNTTLIKLDHFDRVYWWK